jgi:hypothetical protein
MNIHKKVLGTLDKVYATCIGKVDDELAFIGASEGEGAGQAFIGENKTVMWDKPGGTMNVIPVPGRENEFYATQKFLPVFAAADCTLNHVKYHDGQWQVTEIMKFPYLHRFDLFEKNGALYFFGATLCEAKEFQQDWSKPGSVYIGKLGADLTKKFTVKRLYTGITKNHGLCYANWDGKGIYLVTGVEGVFSLVIPEKPAQDEWQINKIMEHEVSDIAACDIDHDGSLELATLEPFHGNKCIIYKNIGEKFQPIKEFPIDFGHVIWGGEIAGSPTFLLGYRSAKMELSAIYQDGNELKERVIDQNVGPSQISVCHQDGKDYILSANRQINELAVYEITK